MDAVLSALSLVPNNVHIKYLHQIRALPCVCKGVVFDFRYVASKWFVVQFNKSNDESPKAYCRFMMKYSVINLTNAACLMCPELIKTVNGCTTAGIYAILSNPFHESIMNALISRSDFHLHNTMTTAITCNNLQAFQYLLKYYTDIDSIVIELIGYVGKRDPFIDVVMTKYDFKLKEFIQRNQLYFDEHPVIMEAILVGSRRLANHDEPGFLDSFPTPKKSNNIRSRYLSVMIAYKHK